MVLESHTLDYAGYRKRLEEITEKHLSPKREFKYRPMSGVSEDLIKMARAENENSRWLLGKQQKLQQEMDLAALEAKTGPGKRRERRAESRKSAKAAQREKAKQRVGQEKKKKPVTKRRSVRLSPNPAKKRQNASFLRPKTGKSKRARR